MNLSISAISLISVTWRRPVLYQFLWHIFGLALILGMVPAVAWGNSFFWEVEESRPLVSLIFIVYLGTLWANSRMLRYPIRNGEKVIFVNLSVAFLILLVFLVFSQLSYSRGFLLMAYLTSLAWLWLGFRLLVSTRLRIALIPGGIADELSTLRNGTWLRLTNSTATIKASGVVVDHHAVSNQEWVSFLAKCALQDIPVYDATLVYEDMTGRVSPNQSSENHFEKISLPPLYPSVKRGLDLLFVLFSLPLTLPLIGVIALLIRLDSAGPSFFQQMRMGEGGKNFLMVKFRTMYVDDNQEGPRFAGDEGHRITRMGRFLRRFRLDELPQLWNVLRGEMSLIGPRPEQVPFAQYFSAQISLYPYRHIVKPGITGWAQINHGYASGSEETRVKLAYDLYYVKYLSFWLDFLIVMRTIYTVIMGHGAK